LLRTGNTPVSPVLFSSFENATTGIEQPRSQGRINPRQEHAMRSMRMIATATLLASSTFGVFGPSSPARAKTPADIAINGTYQATSIGSWGKINQQYNQQQEVTAKWTISTICTTMEDCTGTVTSDQGWTAPVTMTDGLVWYLKHDVKDWEKCQDGTAYTGKQTYWFYPIESSTGQPLIGSPLLTGKDKTIGPSGACGQNKWLEIEIPFRMDKLS
jgi:hypothetical protein